MASIHLENVCRNYGPVEAVRDVSLVVEEGEFFSLLGPSGSGKTTLLRIIAGFEYPRQGRVRIGEREVTELPPEQRKVGMVFQNYALFPHLNVFDNVAYGLRVMKMPRRERKRRVEEMLSLVELDGYEDREIHALSGGQQQRVALARALAPHPQVLLMDEPLSNLDTRLRFQTRRQIRDLQRRLGMTTVYVTHDQSEALALSDRLAVMLDGRIAQTGSPSEIYHSPVDLRVAEFLGEMNLFECRILDFETDETVVLELMGEAIRTTGGRLLSRIRKGDRMRVGLRPESFGPEGMFGSFVVGKLMSLSYEGQVWRFEMETAGRVVRCVWPTSWESPGSGKGERVTVSFDPSSLIFFPDSL